MNHKKRTEFIKSMGRIFVEHNRNGDSFISTRETIDILFEFETLIRKDQKEKDAETFSKSGFTLRKKSCIRKLIMEADQ